MNTLNGWRHIALGELLQKNERMTPIQPEVQYREVTIRLWGKGIVLRRSVLGADIAAERRFQISAEQFILSRIDARNGAIGIVPPNLDGAIVTNDFPSFDIDQSRLLPRFLSWLTKRPFFMEMCRRASEGTTNRIRLKEDRFLRLSIPVPSIEEQERISRKLERLANFVEQAEGCFARIDAKSRALLRSAFAAISQNAPRDSMGHVAPLVRRQVEPRLGEGYPELGIRSFGKGTFHKPSLDYLALGSKKLYRIEPGDLVFNNVFAWEGAVAVAQPQDEARFGSHRFITCVPKAGVAHADYLCFYFLTPDGLRQIGEASPGGAGRNRTLGLEKLAAIQVPIPPYQQQVRFARLLAKMRAAATCSTKSRINMNAIVPSALDLAFRGAN